MPRKPRIHYYGAVYHVITQGNNRNHVFYEEDDKKKYLDLIQNYQSKYQFLLYAFVLMDNHIHLLVEVKDYPLSKIMQGIQMSFTQFINRKYKRAGHVFQQRYQAELCKNDHTLLPLIKHIHNHPVQAGITTSPDYLWSSHLHYIADKPSFVDTAYPLSLLDPNPETALDKYFELMYDTSWEDQPQGYKLTLVTSPIRPNRDKEISFSSGQLDKILAHLSRQTGLSKDRILKKSNKPEIAKARRLLIYILISQNIMSRSETANYLGITPSAVTKAFNEAADDERFEEILRRHFFDDQSRTKA